MINIMHVVGSLAQNMGGPTRSVSTLCEHLSRIGVNINITTVDFGSTYGPNISPSLQHGRTIFQKGWGNEGFGLRYAPGFKRILSQECREQHTDILHDHGVWLQSDHAAAAVSRRRGCPLIITPRGMLEPWALRHKSWKKQLAWRLYQRRDMEMAVVLHATSEQEAFNLRQLGLRQTIAVIPNGVHFPVEMPVVSKSTEERMILFLSRIHQVKGLLHLVNAWVKARQTGWKIVIAGTDQWGYQAVVEEAVRAAKLEHDVCFVGTVEGDAKWALYRQADIFVLPTFSENFGIVVAEALAAGVPVITTKGAPWESLRSQGCGWWTDIGAEPLAEALREAMALSDAERFDMGRRGRQFVEAHFSWPKIAAEMKKVYEWILMGGQAPACVNTI